MTYLPQYEVVFVGTDEACRVGVIIGRADNGREVQILMEQHLNFPEHDYDWKLIDGVYYAFIL